MKVRSHAHPRTALAHCRGGRGSTSTHSEPEAHLWWAKLCATKIGRPFSPGVLDFWFEIQRSCNWRDTCKLRYVMMKVSPSGHPVDVGGLASLEGAPGVGGQPTGGGMNRATWLRAHHYLLGLSFLIFSCGEAADVAPPDHLPEGHMVSPGGAGPGEGSGGVPAVNGGSSATGGTNDDQSGTGGGAPTEGTSSGGASGTGGTSSGGTLTGGNSGTDGEESAPLAVFVGGVAGLDSLTDPENSDEFRAEGGGLYLHTVGWSNLSLTERKKILKVFQGRPSVVEMGYTNGNYTARQNAYKKLYHDLGLRPDVITINAFSSDREPPPDEFQKAVDAYRALGLAAHTEVYATFEYQNFPSKIPIIQKNHVSDRKDFQKIIRIGGGLTLDTPSAVFFRRDQRYRDWVIDAIKWTQSQGLIAAVIFSPNSSKTNYDEDTLKYLNYLDKNEALPDRYYVENYAGKGTPDNYPNIVGNEDTPHHQLGCARMIQETVPKLQSE